MAVLNFDNKSVSIPSGGEAKAVFLSGSIDASTNQTFESQLSEILSSGTNKVLLVLTNVKYINSTGLGTIVKCVDTFRESDGDIKLVGVPTKVIALFEMLGLLALFETYDTIEDAVASFGGAEESGADTSPQVEFPIQFKHPKSGMGLNVTQPGRFKDPRSGDYFSVNPDGTIEFYEMTKVKVVDIKLPCEERFAEPLKAMVSTIIATVGLGDQVATLMDYAVGEVWSSIARNVADPQETCNVILVGDQEKLQIGVLNYGHALNPQSTEPLIATFRQSLDDVRNVSLPTRGQLLVLIKRA